MSLMTIIAAMGSSPGAPAPPPEVSNDKNVRSIALDPALTAQSLDYNAFGFFVVNKELNRVTRLECVGTGHLSDHKGYYRHYNIATDTHDSTQTLFLNPETGQNYMTVAGGIMDDGGTKTNAEIVVFACKSANNLNGGDWSSTNQYMKLNSNTMAVTKSLTDYLGGTSGLTNYGRSWALGRLAYLGTPGHYAIAITSQTTPDITPRYSNIAILKTTDYFETFTRKLIIDTIPDHSETVIEYMGSGKMIAFVRNDLGGSWSTYYSSDSGDTWTARGLCGLGHWNGQVKIMYTVMHAGKLYIILQCRDSGFIMVSKDNDPALIFDNVNNFQPLQLVDYNNRQSVGYNGLGYPSMDVIVDGATPIWYLEWSMETVWSSTGTASGKAEMRYTRWNLIDPTIKTAPAAPQLDVTFTDATGINVTIRNPLTTPTGYTNQELDSIDYWLFDVALDAGFTSFATAKYYNDHLSELLQNKRLLGTTLFLRNLTSSTTYYIRIKAVNSMGESSYAIINATTL